MASPVRVAICSSAVVGGRSWKGYEFRAIDGVTIHPVLCGIALTDRRPPVSVGVMVGGWVSVEPVCCLGFVVFPGCRSDRTSVRLGDGIGDRSEPWLRRRVCW